MDFDLETNVVITDENKKAMEELYGAIPSDSELLKAPETHTFEEANEDLIQDAFKETEEVDFNEISE